MRKASVPLLLALFAFAPQSNAGSSDESKEQTASEETSKTKVVIYPILINAPIFGANIDLPSLPGGGVGGVEISGETDTKLNGAVSAGVSLDSPRWFLDFNGLWAGLTAERNNPLVKVETDAVYLHLTAGLHFSRDFSVTGGFRYMGLSIHAKAGDVLDARFKPDVWDPMVGVDWRRSINDRWNVEANFQGGGFGVGSDVDLSAQVRADWRFARHFSLNFGYNYLYYKMSVANVTVGPFERELIVKQSLNGPQFGLGIWF